MLRERQEWRAQCRTLQNSELDRLRELFVPSNRVEIGDLNEAGRVVILRALADDSSGWSVQAVLTPMHPLREAAVLKLSLRDEASDDFRLKDHIATVRASIERTMHQIVSERAGQTLLVELVVAIDETVAKIAPLQPSTEPVKLALVVNADAAVATDDVDFVGSWAQSRDFAMSKPEFDVPDGATMTLVGTRLFVIGGFNANDQVPIVRIFDLASRTWSVPPSNYRYLRVNMGGHCTVRVGDSLYSFGGVVSHVSDHAVAIFNTKTMLWSFVKPPFAADLRWLTGTRVGEDIYLIGGISSAVNVPGSGLGRHVYVFNTKNNAFRTFQCTSPACVEHAPQPAGLEALNRPIYNAVVAMHDRLSSFPMLSHHTTTLVGDWLVVHGGLFDCEASARTLCLNWRNFSVHELPVCDTVRPRSQHVAARIGERFIAFFGGCAASDFVSQIDILDMYRQEWHARTPQSNRVARIGGAALALHSGEVLLLFGHASIDDARVRASFYVSTVTVHRVLQPRPPVLIDLGLPRPTLPSQLALTLAQAVETGEYSDISYRSLRLHRAVLAARCPRLIELIDESHRDLGDISDGTLCAVVKLLYADVPLTGLSDAELRALSAVLRWDTENAEPLLLSFAAFFDNDELRERTADLTFVCASGEDGGGDVRLGVHRLFVNRVDHFRAILGAGMIESVTGEIRIGESAECMRAALRFFYCDMLDAASAEVGVELLSFADRVGATVLKQHTERMIESFYDFGDLGNVVDLVDIAERTTAPHLLRRSLNVLQSEFGCKEVLDFINGDTVSAAVSKSALELIRNTVRPSIVTLLHQ